MIKEFKNKRKENISLYFKNSINSIDTLPLKKKIKLKQNILEQLENPPDNFGEETIENFRNDLWSKSLLIKTALLKSLEMSSGKDVAGLDFFVRVHRITEKDFEVETNIGCILGLEDLSLSTIIQKGMLSINENNQKIEEMKTFNALPVFMEDELLIYQENSNFLLQRLSSDSKILEDRFTRVVRIKGFPEININNPDIKVDISKLIEIRNSKECKEFRDWLNTIDKDTDIELFDRLEGFKSKLNLLFNSTSGQIIRLLFYGGLGFTPGGGAFIGLGLGALDTFLLSKVLPKSGPISFIDKQLPSIFRKL